MGLRQGECCKRRFAVFRAGDDKKCFQQDRVTGYFYRNPVFAINQGFSKIPHRVG